MLPSSHLSSHSHRQQGSMGYSLENYCNHNQFKNVHRTWPRGIQESLQGRVKTAFTVIINEEHSLRRATLLFPYPVSASPSLDMIYITNHWSHQSIQIPCHRWKYYLLSAKRHRQVFCNFIYGRKNPHWWKTHVQDSRPLLHGLDDSCCLGEQMNVWGCSVLNRGSWQPAKPSPMTGDRFLSKD